MATLGPDDVPKGGLHSEHDLALVVRSAELAVPGDKILSAAGRVVLVHIYQWKEWQIT
jgi:hypothetical protein